MKRKSFQRIGRIGSFFLFFLTCQHFSGLSNVNSQTDFGNGIQPLIELTGQTIHTLIPAPIHSLIFPEDIKDYLQKLEGAPPDWTQLRHTDITKQSERLFKFNRQRDTARLAKTTLLKQPVAFVWAGILRQYLPEFQGFSLALGPERTNTSWGIVRFKPIDLPDYLVAVPTRERRNQLLAQQRQGQHIEIVILCIGTLITDESLIYGFSHDEHQDGIILPVVSIQNIMYILKPS